MAKHFSKDDSINTILEGMDNSGANTEKMHAGQCFLQYKLHQELLGEQNTYNAKQLFWTRCLAIATWFLVIATLLIVKCG